MDSLSSILNNRKLESVTLTQLLESDRVNYSLAIPESWPHHHKKLLEIGSRLTFIVNKSRNSDLPLHLHIQDGEESSLVPNLPVEAINYRTEGFILWLPSIQAHGVRLVEGYTILNQSPTRPRTCGWEHKEYAQYKSAKAECQFDRERAPIFSTTIFMYDIKKSG